MGPGLPQTTGYLTMPSPQGTQTFLVYRESNHAESTWNLTMPSLQGT